MSFLGGATGASKRADCCGSFEALSTVTRSSPNPLGKRGKLQRPYRSRYRIWRFSHRNLGEKRRLVDHRESGDRRGQQEPGRFGSRQLQWRRSGGTWRGGGRRRPRPRDRGHAARAARPARALPRVASGAAWCSTGYQLPATFGRAQVTVICTVRDPPPGSLPPGSPGICPALRVIYSH